MPEAEQADHASMPQAVLRLQDTGLGVFRRLLQPQGLELVEVPLETPIPGSHWGDEEAGLIGHQLFVRDDTPVHSVLHEAGHWLLMNEARRASLHTDAKGSAAEENAVCYLQILLSEQVPGMGRERMCADMDAWGYSFRLGSASRWFHHDAEDARSFLAQRGLPDRVLVNCQR